MFHCLGVLEFAYSLYDYINCRWSTTCYPRSIQADITGVSRLESLGFGMYLGLQRGKIFPPLNLSLLMKRYINNKSTFFLNIAGLFIFTPYHHYSAGPGNYRFHWTERHKQNFQVYSGGALLLYKKLSSQ